MRSSAGWRAAALWAALVLAACGRPSGEGPGSGAPPDAGSAIARESGGTAPWRQAVADALDAARYAPRASTAGGAGSGAAPGTPRIEAHNAASQLRISWDDQGARIGVESVAVAAGASPAEVQIRYLPPDGTSLEPFRLGDCQLDGGRDEDGDCVRRVERRGAGFVEWWENSPRGLQQGFDLWDAEQATAPLRVAVSGAAAVRVDDDGAGASFDLSQSIGIIRYSGLVAEDAAGAPLPAALEPDPAGLRIVLDAEVVSAARLPIRVDPWITGVGWTDEGDQSGAQYGCDIAGAGDVNGEIGRASCRERV